MHNKKGVVIYINKYTCRYKDLIYRTHRYNNSNKKQFCEHRWHAYTNNIDRSTKHSRPLSQLTNLPSEWNVG